MQQPTNINREDFGVYVTMGLLGAGIGLLVGAYLHSRLQQKRSDEQYYINHLESKEQQNEQDRIQQTSTPIDTESERTDDEPTSVSGDASRVSESSGTYEGARRGASKSDGTSGNSGVDDDERRSNFGHIEREETITKQRAKKEKVNYAKISSDYRPDDDVLGRSKPDLDELFEDDTDISRYQILTEDPREDHRVKRVKKLLYSTADDSIVTVVSGRHIPMTNADAVLGDGTIDTVMQLLMLDNYDEVFVHDVELNKAYSVSLLVDNKR